MTTRISVTLPGVLQRGEKTYHSSGGLDAEPADVPESRLAEIDALVGLAIG